MIPPRKCDDETVSTNISSNTGQAPAITAHYTQSIIIDSIDYVPRIGNIGFHGQFMLHLAFAAAETVTINFTKRASDLVQIQ